MGSQELQIPSINFSNLDPKQPNGCNWEETRIQVFSALETYGCFDAVYNGVGSELNEALFGSVVPEMFALPLERKEMNKSKYYLGYIGNIMGMDYETLRIQDAQDPSSVEQFAQMLYPEGNQFFRTDGGKYDISKSRHGEYSSSHLESLTYRLRFARYGDLEEKEAKVSLWSHKDPNLITIIRQNGVEGLEVLTKDEEWIRVAPSPDSFTIVIGETMEVLTNGRLIAPVHRVSVNKKRYSVMLGSLPKEGYVIEVPKEIIDEHHPLKYSPFDIYKYLEFMTSPDGHQYAPDYLKAFYDFPKNELEKKVVEE